MDQMNDLTEAEIADYLRMRQGLYQLLAEVFRAEADEDMLERLAACELPCVDSGSVLDAGFADLRSYLDARDADSVRQLSSEFARLFLGAGVSEIELMASPYESVYTSEERLLMQDARDNMMRLYAEQGVSVVAVGNEPEDHLSFELAFAALLFGRAADALQVGEAARAAEEMRVLRRLFDDHICCWVPSFCSDVIRLARTRFYVANARILLDSVCGEPLSLAFVHGQLDVNAEAFAGEPLDAAVFDGGAPQLEQEEVCTLTREQMRQEADRLFERMAFLKRVFVKVLRFCKQPRTTDQIHEFTQTAMRHITCAYGPTEVRLMLHQAFCLERTEVPQTDGVEAPMTQWLTTEIGSERISEHDPFKSTRELLSRDLSWISGYRDTLAVIKNGTGTFKEVEEVIKATDLYRVQNKHASMFLKRLEEAGAIEWQGRWTLTSCGEQTLETLLAG